MFRFFHSLRQRLITTNKFGKYLLYAIGEIVLIVVGILIALYLDNINAEKQAREIETELLSELKSNLVNNIKILERTLESESQYLSYNQMILDYLDHQKPYTKELEKAFGVYFWTVTTNPVTGGYEYLKSKGVDLISNDSLRNRISYVFENEFSILKNENEVWSNNLQQNISYPYHVRRFRRYFATDSNDVELELAKPFNYASLLEDEEFKSINTEIISNRKWNINSLEKLIGEIEELITEINTELDN